MTEKIWWSGAWVDIGGGAAAGASYPPALTGDNVTASGASARASVIVGTSATPHTLGSWVEIDPSLSQDCDAIIAYFVGNTGGGATDTSTLLQIGTGAAAAETVWATQSVGYGAAGQIIWFPGRIAAGTRVAARAQSIVASKSTGGVVYSFVKVNPNAPLGQPVSIGANFTTSKGVTITAPGLTNTKGAWTELTASTSVDIAAITFGVQGAGGTTMAAAGVLMDVAVGAASSEVIILADLLIQGGTGESYDWRVPPIYSVNIPAGSRVAARYQTNNANNALDLIMIGAPPA